MLLFTIAVGFAGVFLLFLMVARVNKKSLADTQNFLDKQEFEERKHTIATHVPQTVAELLAKQFLNHPSFVVYRFVNPDLTDKSMTISQLCRAACRVANFLRSNGVSNGDKVFVLYPPCIDVFPAIYGCILYGAVMVPVAPINPARFAAGVRALQRMAQNGKITYGLIPRSLSAIYFATSLTNKKDVREAFNCVKWLHPPTGIPSRAHSQEAEQEILSVLHRGAQDDLIGLQYTSGSTSEPKGVMITNRTLLSNLSLMHRHAGTQCGDTIVAWAPHFHDMGLVAGMFHSLYVPLEYCYISPLEFLKRPALWMDAIKKYKGKFTAAPNSGYELLITRTTLEERKSFDFSSILYCITGAEPVRAETMEAFGRLFASQGFTMNKWYPHYGMAEHMVYLCGKGIEHAEDAPRILYCDAEALERNIVICYTKEEATEKAAKNPQLRFRSVVSHGICPVTHCIVDPETKQALPPLHVGEFWVSSPSVSPGYYGDVNLSNEMMHATSANESHEYEYQGVASFAKIDSEDDLSCTTTKHTRIRGCSTTQQKREYLRTGDYAFLDTHNELYVLGRLKDLIIIAGRNIAPQDIEKAIEEHCTVVTKGSVAAFQIPDMRGELSDVSIACETECMLTNTLAATGNAIASSVFAEFNFSPCSIIFLPPKTMPKTASGKIQRSKCRDLVTTNRLKIIFTWTSSVHATNIPQRNRTYPASSDLEVIIAEILCSVLKSHQKPTEIDLTASFAAHGLSSAQAVLLAATLEKRLDKIQVQPADVYAYPSPLLLARHLAEHRLAPKIPSEQHTLSQPSSKNIECCCSSVVGIGLQLPCNVSSVDDFWNFLCARRSALGPITAERQTLARRMGLSFDGQYPHSIAMLKADAVSSFDPPFFGMSHEEAAAMDPQHRLLLITAWHALEDAGVTPDALKRCGVFVGLCGHDHEAVLQRAGTYTAIGAATAIAANRISHFLGCEGPSETIDTACSSSLVALAAAHNAINHGECDAAIVAGVNLCLSSRSSVALQQAHFLSQEGHCAPFEEGADGYARGEGAVAVLITSKEFAAAHRLRNYCTINGCCVNHCGNRSNGLTAPNSVAQAECISGALNDANLGPEDLDYVEAHGTGTVLGDPIECSALQQVFGMRHRPLLVGSIKGLIGHLEGAAGLAGVVRCAVSLYKEQITPSFPAGTQFQPNHHLLPYLQPQGVLKIVTERKPLKMCDRNTLYFGVSSFGFGGTNAHVILGQADKEEELLGKFLTATTSPSAVKKETLSNIYSCSSKPQTVSNPISSSTVPSSEAIFYTDLPMTKKQLTSNKNHDAVLQGNTFTMLPITAHSLSALNKLTSRYYTLLASHQEDTNFFSKLCYLTMQCRGDRGSHRGVIVARNTPEAVKTSEHLLYSMTQNHNSKLSKERTTNVKALRCEVPAALKSRSRHRIGLVFTGQGGGWEQMGRKLYATSAIFRSGFDEASDAIARQSQGINPKSEIQSPTKSTDCTVSHPFLFALQHGLVKLLSHISGNHCVIAAVIGHSTGELAAAECAGMLSLDEAAWLVVTRSRLLSEANGQGGMLALATDEEHAQKYLSSAAEDAAIAALNSSVSTVISGPNEVIRSITTEAERDGIKCTHLSVPIPYHHHRLLAQIAERFEAEIEKKYFSSATQSKYSTYHKHTEISGASTENINITPTKNEKTNDERTLMISTCTGRLVERATIMSPKYWRNQLSNPVLFKKAVQTLAAATPLDAVIEVGPHPLLLKDILTEWPPEKPVLLFPTMTHRDGEGNGEELPALLSAQFYAHGLIDKGDLPRILLTYPEGRRQMAGMLPLYPFDCADCVAEYEEHDNDFGQQLPIATRGQFGNPFSGVPMAQTTDSLFSRQLIIDTKMPVFHFLLDHVFHEIPLFPGVCFAAAVEGMTKSQIFTQLSELLGDDEEARSIKVAATKFVIKEVSFDQGLFISAPCILRTLVMKKEESPEKNEDSIGQQISGTYPFIIESELVNESAASKRHAHGKLLTGSTATHIMSEQQKLFSRPKVPPRVLMNQLPRHSTGTALRSRGQSFGLALGESFSAIKSFGMNEPGTLAVARLVIPQILVDTATPRADKTPNREAAFTIHPALLDAGLQTFGGAAVFNRTKFREALKEHTLLEAKRLLFASEIHEPLDQPTRAQITEVLCRLSTPEKSGVFLPHTLTNFVVHSSPTSEVIYAIATIDTIEDTGRGSADHASGSVALYDGSSGEVLASVEHMSWDFVENAAAMHDWLYHITESPLNHPQKFTGDIAFLAFEAVKGLPWTYQIISFHRAVPAQDHIVVSLDMSSRLCTEKLSTMPLLLNKLFIVLSREKTPKDVTVFLHNVSRSYISAAAKGAVVGYIRSAAKEFHSLCIKVVEGAPENVLYVAGIPEAGEFVSDAQCSRRSLECMNARHIDNYSLTFKSVVIFGAGALSQAISMQLVVTAIRQSEQGDLLITIASRSAPKGEFKELAAMANAAIGRQVISFVQCDVSSQQSVTDVLLRTAHLTHVFHCAGVLRDRPATEITVEDFDGTIEPKGNGLLNIVTALSDNEQMFSEFDRVVCCSSLAAILGNIGQCAYTSANGVLDSVAAAQGTRFPRVLSLNLGPLSGGGMFAQLGEAYQQLSEDEGIHALPTECAAAAIIQLVLSPDQFTGQLALADIQWKESSGLYSALTTGLIDKGKCKSDTKSDSKKSSESIARFLITEVSERLGISEGQLDTTRPFQEYSMDSLAVMSTAQRLGEFVGHPVSPVALFDYATIEKLAEHLGTAGGTPQTDAPARAKQDSTQLSPMLPEVAVVGMGCRYPSSGSPEKYWDTLVNGICTARDIPKERFDIDKLYSPDPEAPGKILSRRACLVDGYELFDRKFFRISEREARQMDPQQRQLLECAWEAIEDSTLLPEQLAGSKTAVFVGIGGSDYMFKVVDYSKIDGFGGPGNASSVAANRISYAFDLKGPSAAVDTACSSSLVALDAAISAIADRRADAALVGGCNSIFNPAVSITFSKAGMLSKDGQCKAFDAAADGYVRGEGVGVLFIMPLERAEQLRLPVYAVIRGSHVNHVGRSNGLTAPSGPAQEACMRECYRRGRISPSEVCYVEAHGTGTALGDPIEANALGAVCGGQHRMRGCPLLIGSVKTNIGHTECASGVAGVIKCILAIEHRTIPPSLNYNTPNPQIDFEGLRMAVCTKASPLPPAELLSHPAVMGCSSYGFGGANGHVCITEYKKNMLSTLRHERPRPADGIHLLLLSAKSKKSLYSTARQYAEFICANKNKNTRGHAECREIQSTRGSCTNTPQDPRNNVMSEPPVQPELSSLDGSPTQNFLYSACWTAGFRRTVHKYSATFVGRDDKSLVKELISFCEGGTGAVKDSPVNNVVSGLVRTGIPPTVIFVFGGQGSQWGGMGKQLLSTFPLFADAMRALDAEFSPIAGWSLLDELNSSDEAVEQHLRHASIAQPLLFAVQYCLAQCYIKRGVQPAVIIGHSTGEIAACAISGVLALDSAIRIVVWRSLLAQRAESKGKMAHVPLTANKVSGFLHTKGYYRDVSIAAINSGSSCVISGACETVDQCCQELAGVAEASGAVKVLPVCYAYHSQQMVPFKQELSEKLKGALHPGTARLDVLLYSTVTGKRASSEEFLAPEYWGRQLAQPVLFYQALKDAVAASRSAKNSELVFLEISPRAVLGSYIREVVSSITGGHPVLLQAHRNVQDQLIFFYRALGMLAAFQQLRQSILSTVYSTAGTPLRLPHYCFNRKRYWVEQPALIDVFERSKLSEDERQSIAIHRHFFTAKRATANTVRLTGAVELSGAHKYLSDHIVAGEIVFPGTAFLELAIEAGLETLGTAGDKGQEHCTRVSVSQLEVIRPMIFGQREGTFSLLCVGEYDSPEHDRVHLTIYGREKRKEGEKLDWVQYAKGRVCTLPTATSLPPLHRFGELEDTWEFSKTIPSDELYAEMERSGIAYGSPFKLLKKVTYLARSKKETAIPGAVESKVVASVRVSSEHVQTKALAFPCLHPAVIDACCQALAAALPFQGAHVVYNGKVTFLEFQRQEITQCYLPCSYQRVELGMPWTDYITALTCDETSRDNVTEFCEHNTRTLPSLSVEVSQLSITLQNITCCLDIWTEEEEEKEEEEKEEKEKEKVDILKIKENKGKNKKKKLNLLLHIGRFETRSAATINNQLPKIQVQSWKEIFTKHTRVGEKMNRTIAVISNSGKYTKSNLGLSEDDHAAIITFSGIEQLVSELSSLRCNFPHTSVGIVNLLPYESAMLHPTAELLSLSLQGNQNMWKAQEVKSASNDMQNSLLSVAETALEVSQAVARFSLLHSETAVRLFIVTRQAVRATEDDNDCHPVEHALAGLCGVLQSEYPGLKTTMVDLAAEVSLNAIGRLLSPLNDSPLPLPAAPSELALRRKTVDGIAFYLREITSLHETNVTADSLQIDYSSHSQKKQPTNYSVILPQVGDLDSLQLHETFCPELIGDEDIEVEVHYAGLNFRDVMIGLGMYPVKDASAVIGGECAGIVTKVGARVDNFTRGDRVCLMYTGCFSKRIVVPAALAIHVPPCVTLTAASCVLGVFATAHYALRSVGRFKKGESVLIHAATGGVGLAALQIAKRLGLEIFATAGTEEKRAALKRMGIVHVYSSRTLAFADEIMRDTNGNGVDGVLNSLAGEFLTRSLSVLAPGGRFIEIGKRDVYGDSSVGLRVLARNASFNVVAIDSLLAETPFRGKKLLHEVMKCFSTGEYSPPPMTVFRADKASQAFQMMAHARHVGKIVLDFTCTDASVCLNPFEETAPHAPPSPFSSDGSYLITGGTGGFGKALVRFLLKCGVKLVFVISRRSSPREEDLKTFSALEQEYDAAVKYISCDVCKQDDTFSALAAVLECAKENGLPLRGVFHAAGVLNDALLLGQTSTSFARVITPKCKGALNLISACTQANELEYLVLFGSVSTFIGTIGQSNYATANAFLEGLAESSAQHSGKVYCIHWAPMQMQRLTRIDKQGKEVPTPSGGGMFERMTEAERAQVTRAGVLSLVAETGMMEMGAILSDCVAQRERGVAHRHTWSISRIDWKAFARTAPDPLPARFFGARKRAADPVNTAKVASKFIEELLSIATAEEKAEYVLRTVVGIIAKTIGISPMQIDDKAPLSSLGVDSLLAAELKGRFESVIGTTLPISIFLQQRGSASEFSSAILKFLLDNQHDREQFSEDSEEAQETFDGNTAPTKLPTSAASHTPTKKLNCCHIHIRSEEASNQNGAVFILPAFGGSASGLVRLAEQISLQSARDAFVLDYDAMFSRTARANENALAPATMTEWGELCAAEISTLLQQHFPQQHIPVTICGISVGGAVAFEVVRVLIAKKIPVARLILIDSPPSSIIKEHTDTESAVAVICALMGANILYSRAQSSSDGETEKVERTLARLLVDLGSAMNSDTDESITDILSASDETFSDIEKASLHILSEDVHISNDVALKYYATVRHQALCMLHWNPQDRTFSGVSAPSLCINYIHAADSSEEMKQILSLGNKAMIEWRDITFGKEEHINDNHFSIENCHGNHFTILSVHAPELVKIIVDILRK